MKIKRNFTYIGGIRKFKIFIDDEYVSNLKLNKEVEVEQPDKEFSIYFRTMKLEKSKKYLIKTDKPVRIVSNVNPLVRITFWTSFILLVSLMPLTSLLELQFINSLMAIIAVGFLYVIFYYGYLVGRYITFEAYDLEGQIVDKEILN